jgi:hypothetical protein
VRITLSFGSVPSASTSSTAKTIDARPRGPNQPRKATVCRRACVPVIATATGSMRTIVRLRRAYPATAQVTFPSLGSSRAPPKTMKVAAASRAPSCSVR